MVRMVMPAVAEMSSRGDRVIDADDIRYLNVMKVFQHVVDKRKTNAYAKTVAGASPLSMLPSPAPPMRAPQ
jgi:hypothetical protein